MRMEMRSICQLLVGAAALFLATGTVSPALSTPLSDREKQTFSNALMRLCIEMITKDAPKTPQYYSRPPFTIEEIWDYCKYSSEMIADLITSEEHPKSKEPWESIRESVREKVECIVVEKCKKHLNLPDPSQFQYGRCWKG